MKKKIIASFTKCYNQAFMPPHFLAFLIDPCFCRLKLTDSKKKSWHVQKKILEQVFYQLKECMILNHNVKSVTKMGIYWEKKTAGI